MMLLPYLVTLVAFTGLVRTSPIAANEEKDTEPEKRNSNYCYINGYVYRHGEVFTLGNIRCIKYRCMHGSHDYYEEGCDAFGQCWPINHQFRHQCRDFRCESHNIGRGYKQYQAKPIGPSMCQDVYGQCRRPGETFSFNIKGIVRHSCWCSLEGDSIRYQCYS